MKSGTPFTLVSFSSSRVCVSRYRCANWGLKVTRKLSCVLILKKNNNNPSMYQVQVCKAPLLVITLAEGSCKGLWVFLHYEVQTALFMFTAPRCQGISSHKLFTTAHSARFTNADARWCMSLDSNTGGKWKKAILKMDGKPTTPTMPWSKWQMRFGQHSFALLLTPFYFPAGHFTDWADCNIWRYTVRREMLKKKNK